MGSRYQTPCRLFFVFSPEVTSLSISPTFSISLKLLLSGWQSLQGGPSRLVGQEEGEDSVAKSLVAGALPCAKSARFIRAWSLAPQGAESVPWCFSLCRCSWSSELWRKASELFAKCRCLVNTKLHLGNSLLLAVILHFYSWHRHLNQRTVTFQRLWKQFGYVPTP